MKNTKFTYFRQVPPEEQESPWYRYHPEEVWPDIYIAGNPHFTGLRTKKFSEITNNCVKNSKENFCNALTEFHEKPYDNCVIHGDSQSDWNVVYFPKDELFHFFTLAGDYFNTCTEFYITTESDDDFSARVYGFYTYKAYNLATYIDELRAYEMGEPVVSLFEGYTKSPKFSQFQSLGGETI